MTKPRDTYKYCHRVRGRKVHCGITNSLTRRQREHRQTFGGGRIKQIGRRTTRAAAQKWEEKHGY